MGKATAASNQNATTTAMSVTTINQIERRSCQTSQIAAAWRGRDERVARGNNNVSINICGCAHRSGMLYERVSEWAAAPYMGLRARAGGRGKLQKQIGMCVYGNWLYEWTNEFMNEIVVYACRQTLVCVRACVCTRRWNRMNESKVCGGPEWGRYMREEWCMLVGFVCIGPTLLRNVMRAYNNNNANGNKINKTNGY